MSKTSADNNSHEPSTSDGTDSFRALSDATRQRLLQLLLREELSVSELVDVLGKPQSTVSRHLTMLRRVGLVRDRRNGTAVLCSVGAFSGELGDIRSLLTEWLHQQPLPDILADRLQHVLRRRQDETIGFFERIGNRWEELRKRAFGETFAIEAFLALLPTEWTVADIGTGTGTLLPLLSRHFQRVIAVEPTPAMLECARRRVDVHGARNITLQHGDLGHLQLKDGVCDLAIACLVLHHVAEPATALVEMHRVLRPGGYVLVVEQHQHENQSFQDMMGDHWRGFDPADLSRQIEAVGFARVRSRDLVTAAGKADSVDSPRLFVTTAWRPNDGPSPTTNTYSSSRD